MAGLLICHLGLTGQVQVFREKQGLRTVIQNSVEN